MRLANVAVARSQPDARSSPEAREPAAPQGPRPGRLRDAPAALWASGRAADLAAAPSDQARKGALDSGLGHAPGRGLGAPGLDARGRHVRAALREMRAQAQGD